jgi:hypothetical protein
MQKGKLAHRSRMISARIAATAFGALVLILASTMGAQIPNRVITWGPNTPDWNRALHLGGVRMGCSSAPGGCVGYVEQLAKSQGVDTAFLAISLNRGTVISYAREYSQLSLSHPTLYEVGFDDFVGQCEKQQLDPSSLSALLRELAHELKAANPKLHLGVTIYEDELTSTRFPLVQLDEQFRKSVDFVHLYPHYRKEAQSFSASVQKAAELFPASKIIAGNYAYDRRDYVPCARGNPTPCSNQEEISLFAQSLKERLAMLGSSNVEWIEFYPGNFGSEAHWDRWKDPRACHQERIQECDENTRALREVVRQVLNH